MTLLKLTAASDAAVVAANLWRSGQAAVEAAGPVWAQAENAYFACSPDGRNKEAFSLAERRWTSICEDADWLLASALLTRPTSAQGAIAVLNVALEADGGELENEHVGSAIKNVRDYLVDRFALCSREALPDETLDAAGRLCARASSSLNDASRIRFGSPQTSPC